MWTYYGSKGNIVGLYPPPMHDRIIEPFAGTARYSLRYFEKDITLVDKYEVITKIWKWLQVCSEKDILGLPRFKEGDKVKDFGLCEEAEMLMGYFAGKSVATPNKTATHRATTARPNHINYHLKKIAGNLYKIRPWKIIHGSYEDLPNESATYFIDPPYQFGGYVYKENKIDFSFLANWCKSRNGQVIVCENTKADWLPFAPLKTQRGSVHRTTEAIWLNDETQLGQQNFMKLVEERITA